MWRSLLSYRGLLPISKEDGSSEQNSSSGLKDSIEIGHCGKSCVVDGLEISVVGGKCSCVQGLS